MEMFCSVKFPKENDYYIMSMSCFIEVSNDITKLKQYDDIEKKSVISNRYIRKRIDYGFDPPKIEIIFNNKTYQFEINKISPSKAVDVCNFYDHLLKKKNLQLFILHIKILLRMESHEKKNKSDDIGGYTTKIIRTNNKGFIQKKFILIN